MGRSSGMRGECGLHGEGSVKGLCVQVRDKAVGWVMYLLHVVPPDEPEEGAQGPLPYRSRLAKGVPEGGIVTRHIVKGPEGEQREP